MENDIKNNEHTHNLNNKNGIKKYYINNKEELLNKDIWSIIITYLNYEDNWKIILLKKENLELLYSDLCPKEIFQNFNKLIKIKTKQITEIVLKNIKINRYDDVFTTYNNINDLECYKNCFLYKNGEIFQVYSRLIQFFYRNKKQYPNLIDLNKNMNLINNYRSLNKYENQLFFHININTNEKDIFNRGNDIMKNFFMNMNKFFFYEKWKDLIDWDFFNLFGGSLLRCLMKNTENIENIYDYQDLDFFVIRNYYARHFDFDYYDKDEFENKIIEFMKKIEGKYKFYAHYEIGYQRINIYINFSEPLNENKTEKKNFRKKYLYARDLKTIPIYKERFFKFVKDKINKHGYIVKVYKQSENIIKKINENLYSKNNNNNKAFVKFQFINKDFRKNFLGIDEDMRKDIIYGFDLDCCQLCFQKENLYSTIAFIQSYNTNTFINYNLNLGNYKNNKIPYRNFKYIKRGLNLLLSYEFKTIEKKFIEETKKKYEEYLKTINTNSIKLSQRDIVYLKKTKNDSQSLLNEFIKFLN